VEGKTWKNGNKKIKIKIGKRASILDSDSPKTRSVAVVAGGSALIMETKSSKYRFKSQFVSPTIQIPDTEGLPRFVLCLLNERLSLRAKAVFHTVRNAKN
jgi:hypothetical protein